MPARLSADQIKMFQDRPQWLNSVFETSDLRYLGSGETGPVFLATNSKATLTYKSAPFISSLSESISTQILSKFESKYFHVNILNWNWTNQYQLMVSDFNAESILSSKYVSGKSLFTLLQDPYLPKIYRDFLNQQYQQFVKRIANELKHPIASQYTRAPTFGYFPESSETNLDLQPTIYGFVIQYDALTQYFSVEYERALGAMPNFIRRIADQLVSGVSIIIKSDNIIVDENFNLYLVDPS